MALLDFLRLREVGARAPSIMPGTVGKVEATPDQATIHIGRQMILSRPMPGLFGNPPTSEGWALRADYLGENENRATMAQEQQYRQQLSPRQTQSDVIAAWPTA